MMTCTITPHCLRRAFITVAPYSLIKESKKDMMKEYERVALHLDKVKLVLQRLIDVQKVKACASKDDPLELCSPMTKVTLVAKGKNLFDDSAENILGGSRLGNKFCDSSKSQVLRSSSTDKERANNVAKDQSCDMLCVACFSSMLLVVCILFDANQCSFNYFRSYMLIENATCCSRFFVGNGLASVNVYRF
ncbi:hypothetical protein HN873_051385 [Arachis hypogaea]